MRGLCRERRVCLATYEGRHGALDRIGLLSIHDALGAEDFVPAEANMGSVKYVGQCGH